MAELDCWRDAVRVETRMGVREQPGAELAAVEIGLHRPYPLDAMQERAPAFRAITRDV